MLSIPASLTHYWKHDARSPIALWNIKRKDGITLGFTDAPSDIIHEDVRYYARAVESGFQQYKQGNESPAMKAALDHEILTHSDVLAGRYDNANVTLSYAAYGRMELGSVLVYSGYLSTITLENGLFHATCISIRETLDYAVPVDIFSPLCRAKFGDARCGVNRGHYTHPCYLASIETELSFTVDIPPSNPAFYTQGSVLIESGAHTALTLPIQRVEGSSILSAVVIPKELAPSDKLTLQPGCTKRFSFCKGVYGNVVNFRGEPHLPGAELYGA